MVTRLQAHILELARLYQRWNDYARLCRPYAPHPCQVLLDRVEDIRAGRLDADDAKVTEAMVDAKVALDDF